MTRKRVPFFAVLIGINLYKTVYRDLRPLRGAISDALGFKQYLETCLSVPRDQIISLHNEEATRSKIIEVLKNLSKDGRIHKDDAIFLYYAGHGTEINDPADDSGAARKIQAIVPYDCDVVDDESKIPVPPIPDYMLGFLLSQIAEAKGDNITVILDCCHSASGTRGAGSETDEIARSVELPSTIYSEQLNQELSEVKRILPVSRGPCTTSEFRQRGLESHVLFSACGATQQAKEDNGHGRFSAAFLGLLNQVSPDTLRYSDILTHPHLGPTPHQNPQCEGHRLERTLFNSRELPTLRKSFPVSFDPAENGGIGQYVVKAGTIHNIALDSEFGVYAETDISFSTQICVLHVDKLREFQFTAKLSLSAIDKIHGAEPVIAVHTKFGQQKHLRIHIPPRDGFRKTYDDLVADAPLRHHFDNISHVDESKDAQVQITSIAKTKVRFTMHTKCKAPNLHTITQVAEVDKVDNQRLAQIFHDMVHFYRQLKHDSEIEPFADVELYKLQQDYKRDSDIGHMPRLERVGPNLCTNNVVDLVIPDKEAEKIPYGIRLINTSPLDLYANVFLFSTHDLSICHWVKPYIGRNDRGVDFPLERKANDGSLDIGFGTAGYRPLLFKITPGLNIDVGFLKIYLSTHSVDLAHLAQPSPFELETSRAFGFYEGKTPIAWTNIVIPVILRSSIASVSASVSGIR